MRSAATTQVSSSSVSEEERWEEDEEEAREDGVDRGATKESRPADETLQVETCNVSSRGTCTPSGAAISLSSDDADGSQAYGTTFGLFLGGSSYSSSDGTPLPLPLLSDVVMAKVQTEVAAVATTQVRKWTGGPGVAGR
ncbi:hypothetical protein IscW_ISCW012016 [Ixodes scapularis]|uniref:Uncharacterized protein n=1 Tax=Ixodes scapularis TaxID=6945 RepID=B7QE77_IXOSC|nr:hypothetical protein IscW_ISCW012016 [Ixodes scapularis]|eukprot:XP_002413841.1 hypothetical protein IscW_ISCW012016 [Ixodes scapularis]